MTGQVRLAAVVVEVNDIERSAKLYRDGFGVDLLAAYTPGDDRWLSGPHAEASWREGAYLHLALFQAKGGGPTRGAQLAFTVDDLEAANERALKAGAVLIHPPRDEPWGSTARYADLDGNCISLTQGPRP